MVIPTRELKDTIKYNFCQTFEGSSGPVTARGPTLLRILELSKDATVEEDNGAMLGFRPDLKGFGSELGRVREIHS